MYGSRTHQPERFQEQANKSAETMYADCLVEFDQLADEMNAARQLDQLSDVVHDGHSSAPPSWNVLYSSFREIEEELKSEEEEFRGVMYGSFRVPAHEDGDSERASEEMRREEEEFRGVMYGSFRVPAQEHGDVESASEVWECGLEIAEAECVREHGDTENAPEDWSCLLGLLREQSHSVGSTEAGSVHEGSDVDSV